MNRRFWLGLGLAILLVIGGGLIAVTAYQAGVATTVPAGAATAPAYVYGWGWGWHHLGWGFFGGIGSILFGLLFFFIVFALIRALIWGGPRRGWGGPGWRGRGWYGPWDQHGPTSFEEWHRHAHEPGSGQPPTGEPPTGESSTR